MIYILLIKLVPFLSCCFNDDSWFKQMEELIVSIKFLYHGGISSYDWNNCNIRETLMKFYNNVFLVYVTLR